MHRAVSIAVATAAAVVTAAAATVVVVATAALSTLPTVCTSRVSVQRWNFGGPAIGTTYAAGTPFASSAGELRSWQTHSPVTEADGSPLSDQARKRMLDTSLWANADISITLPASPGNYTLTLHFAETWADREGVRRFDVAAGPAGMTPLPVLRQGLDLFVAGGHRRYVPVDVATRLTVPPGGAGVAIYLTQSTANNPTILGATLARIPAVCSRLPVQPPEISETPPATPKPAATPMHPPPLSLSKGAPQWSPLPPSLPSAARHDHCFVKHQSRFYLIGGRSRSAPGKPTLVYTPSKGSWAHAAPPPYSAGGVHHMQCVSLEDAIYVVGAWTGGHPREKTLPNVLIFHPATDRWTVGDPIPAAHNRGSAAAVVWGGAIYLAGGNRGGHGGHSTSMSLLSRYVPSAEGRAACWKALAPLPRPRDHVYGVLSRGQLVLVGGRDGGSQNAVNAVSTAIDVYSFERNRWRTLEHAALAQGRGAPVVAAIGDVVVVSGGQGGGRVWPQAEVIDMAAERMVTTPGVSMVRGRHASPAVVCNGAAYVVAGSGSLGGSPELCSFEVFSFGPPAACH
ncbi:hypothetical protein MMPV_008279 [Pyropia vietnamensis]